MTSIPPLAQDVAGYAEIQAGLVRGLMQDPAVRRVILQDGSATGDVFQVASALKLHPDLGVVVFSSGPDFGRQRGEWIHRYYTAEWRISTGRVARLVVGQPERAIAEINRRKLLQPHGLESGTVGWATNMLQADLAPGNEATLLRLRSHVLGTRLEHGVTREKLADFVASKQVPLDRPIVVLWSRLSGKAGGLHPDLDSSATVMAQLAEALAGRCTVLVAGDIPERKMLVHRGFAAAIFLGEFWKDPSLLWKDAPRACQLLLFEYLRRRVGTLTHVGMRSGTLDGYALAGHRVVYVVDRATVASDDARMGKLLEDKTVLDHRRVALSRAPKLFGQLSRAGDPGLFARFDLKGALVTVQKTGQARDPAVAPYVALLTRLADVRPKTEQYRYFKTTVVEGMHGVYQVTPGPGNAQALAAVQTLYAELVEYVLREVRERRGLTPDDLRSVVDAVVARD